MLKKVLLGIAAVIGAAVIVIFLQPSTYHVERTVIISAPATTTYAWTADFGKFNAWSPWAELDPKMETKLTAAPMTVGHSYEWNGNDDVGSGKMTLTKVDPNKSVVYTLAFLTPIESTATATISHGAVGDDTEVKWAIDGVNGFSGKLFGLFVSMDKMIGADFEKGLTGLKKAIDAIPPPPPAVVAPPTNGAAPTDGAVVPTEGADAKASDAKPADAKAPDAKPADGKPAAAKK